MALKWVELNFTLEVVGKSINDQASKNALSKVIKSFLLPPSKHIQLQLTKTPTQSQ
jgi:hypothetical protein